MSADTQQLIQQSLQGDQRAFGQIVERYQGAVSAMAYSVTGNLAQSEDLAQEAFIIAWKKLGALQKHESLSAWLCGIARNLARDWMRTQAARPTISMETLDETVQPLGESPVAAQQRRERSDLVWTALAEIPENYREPLILFYREGESIRDIAEALDLSEDNVKQRLSRGRKLLRAEVARTVEDTLADTRPGKAFTAGVIAALPALYVAKAGAAEMTSTSAKAAAAPAAMGALIKITLSVAVVAGLVLGGVGWRLGQLPWGTAEAPTDTERAAVGPVDSGVNQGEKTAVLRTAAADVDTNGVASANSPDTSVSGITVFRGTGTPASNMRVVLVNEDKKHETLSDEQGEFAFQNTEAGEFSLVAFDADFVEAPVDEYRSAVYPITVGQTEDRLDIRLEVPSVGKIYGSVLDTKTGEGIAGVKVSIFRYGAGGSFEGTSDNDGHYTILGLKEGAWLAGLDRDNPILCSRDSKDLVTVVLDSDGRTALDIQVDRGLSFSGRVVDSNGDPIAKADIEASLAGPFPDRDSIGNSSLHSRADGSFTLWGVHPRDLVQLVASYQDLKSYAVVVSPDEHGNIDSPVLKLVPQTEVSGRFVDESGRTIEALAGYRYDNPEVPGSWRYDGNLPAATFQILVPPGEYEFMGRNSLDGMRLTGLPQALHVGTQPVSNLALTVPTSEDFDRADRHSLTGRAITNDGSPTPHFTVSLSTKFPTDAPTRLYGATGEDGAFLFENVPDGMCSIWALPSDEFYLPGSVSDIDPAKTKTVNIVVTRAATLRGKVSAAQTGEPVTNFLVERGTIDSLGARQKSGVPKKTKSERGEFSVPGEVDTNWFLQVTADGLAPLVLTGTALKSGDESAVMEFKLQPGRTVRGAVTNSSNEPIADALVFLDHEIAGRSTRNLGTSKVKTDDAGLFQITSIPDDTEWVYTGKEGFAMTRVPLADQMHVMLGEGGVVEGRVTIGGAAPASPYNVEATAPETGDTVSATIAADGTYRLEGLMELTYLLCVNAGYPTVYFLDEVVSPESGVTITADLNIPSGDSVVWGVARDADGAPLSMPIHCTIGGIAKQTQSDEFGNYRIEGLPAGPASLAVKVPEFDAKGGWTFRALAESSVELEAGTETEHNVALSP